MDGSLCVSLRVSLVAMTFYRSAIYNMCDCAIRREPIRLTKISMEDRTKYALTYAHNLTFCPCVWVCADGTHCREPRLHHRCHRTVYCLSFSLRIGNVLICNRPQGPISHRSIRSFFACRMIESGQTACWKLFRIQNVCGKNRYLDTCASAAVDKKLNRKSALYMET